ncbi:AraC family transcriptional regulator [Clostridium cellulovorans]|uniref:Transcriptional regulator, AraC family n=1 Tax=Clostridium cellulovorans (strain ATCC 35296 / DSM 3052 / OCM 3 / 743B) TaxID=573061 RepID=D9SQL4_CLOC7|nr:AraC family transcriptional regulator [Clostridium cellulovorans]ADL52220.1 transcriptional regulator, AraC family [Clostridium cellulovorans 743B]
MNYITFPVVTEFESKLPVYLVSVGINHTQEHIIRLKGYPHFQWIQCRKGSGMLKINNQTITINENQAMLLFPHTSHEYYSSSEEWIVDWVALNGYAVEEILKNGGIQHSEVFSVSEPELFILRMEKLLELAASYNTIKSLESSKIIYSILMDILAYTSTDKVDYMINQYSKLRPVLDYIDDNYDKIITLQDLSEVANVTPEYLCTVFKKTTGIRVFEYINNIRIKNSKEMILSKKNMPIKEIAKNSGFEDVSYFCSMFKKIEKLTPNEFRKLYGI